MALVTLSARPGTTTPQKVNLAHFIFITEGMSCTIPGSFQMIMSPSEAEHHLDFLTLALSMLTRQLWPVEQQLQPVRHVSLLFGTFFEMHCLYEPIRSIDELYLVNKYCCTTTHV